MVDVANIYKHKNGRLMAYIKETQQVVSYPRLIMEEVIGRKLLPNEQVHHKDGNPLNNDIDNLEVLTFEEHLKIHAEENRKYYDKLMICPMCGKEFLWTAQQQMRFHTNAKRKRYKYQSIGLPFCSKSCAGKYGREVQKNNDIKVHKNNGINIGQPKRKLTNEQVKYIRNNYISGDKEFGGRALARKFNVDKNVIQLIIHNKTYTDV